MLLNKIKFVKNSKEFHDIMKKTEKNFLACECFDINYNFIHWLIKNNNTMKNSKNNIINFLNFVKDNLKADKLFFESRMLKQQTNNYIQKIGKQK